MRIFPAKNIMQYRITDNLPKDKNIDIWDSKQLYKTYDKVIYGKYIYQSLSDNNHFIPSDNVKWYKLRLINQCAYLNTIETDKSYSNNDIYLEYNIPNDCDIIALGGLNGESINIKIEDSDGDVIFEETIDLNKYRPPKMCWYNWIYPTPNSETTTKSYLKKITPNDDQTLKITIYKGFCRASIGLLILSKTIWLGCTLEGITREIKGSLSVDILRGNRKKIRDRKGYIKLTANVAISKEDDNSFGDIYYIDKIQRILEKYTNIPIGVLVVDTDENYSMQLFGVYDTIQTSIRNIGNFELILNGLDSIF